MLRSTGLIDLADVSGEVTVCLTEVWGKCKKSLGQRVQVDARKEEAHKKWRAHELDISEQSTSYMRKEKIMIGE